MARPKITLQVEGARELRDTLKNLAPKEARAILRNAVYGLAVRVRDELKKNVKKDTGDLAKSLKVVRRRRESSPDHPVVDVRGGATAPYMLMLEFGTRRTKAQPFIVPTTEAMRPQVPGHYREEFGKRLEKALKKK